MTNGLPRFQDGDVEIRLSSSDDDTLVLHSYVLALHSPWFKASLSDRWNAQTTAASPGASQHYWIYELRFDKGTSFGLLSKRGQANDTQFESTELQKRLPAVDSGGNTKLDTDRTAYISAHRDLLQAFYHTTPIIDQSITGEVARGVRQLSEVSTAYGSSYVVRGCIEACFRDKHQVHALNPLAVGTMLEIAVELKSASIYQLAVTVMAGMDNGEFEELLPKLEDLHMDELPRRKRTQRADILRSAEHRMFILQGESTSAWGRPVVNVFRQWLADELVSKGSAMGPGYFEPYKSISALARGVDVPSRIESSLYTKVAELRSKLNFAIALSSLRAVAKKAVRIIESMPGFNEEPPAIFTTQDQYMDLIIDQNELPWNH